MSAPSADEICFREPSTSRVRHKRSVRSAGISAHVFIFLLLLLAVPLPAVETPIPPPPTDYVTDTAGFLSAPARATLERRLRDYDRASGHQVVVWIGHTTGGVPIEEWVVKAFEKWKIGRKGLDDGVLLVIMADDRKLRFEVGYGLEGDVPDITAGQIINDVMTPRIRAGDRDAAVLAGVDALIQKIGGPQGSSAVRPSPGQAPRRLPPAPLSLGQMIFFGVLGLIFLFILVTHPTLALYLLWAISSGGRGGGGGGGGGDGGGFSGGGGRSGGGGASGSW